MIELNVEFLEMCLWRIIKYSWWYLKVKLEIVLVIWVMKGLVWYFYFELLKCREINIVCLWMKLFVVVVVILELFLFKLDFVII